MLAQSVTSVSDQTAFAMESISFAASCRTARRAGVRESTSYRPAESPEVSGSSSASSSLASKGFGR